MNKDIRVDSDSMGELNVPADALYGAQTQRAINNFQFSDLVMPQAFLHALLLIKRAAAQTNVGLGVLEEHIAGSIVEAVDSLLKEDVTDHFPIDVFQTGSGTSSNMNANEVIANLAHKTSGISVHPNDHVNMSQSSNDTIPTALHLSAAMQIDQVLLPALEELEAMITSRSQALAHHTKTGRTHLMDAVPLTMAQEMSGWGAQIKAGMDRIEATLPRLHSLAQGGTAVGTGINAPAEFAQHIIARLSDATGLNLTPAANSFEALSSQDTAVELSGALKTVAVSMMKIANDLRWMNSGPLAGLAEIELKALQPGSSIMPGKVNPVLPEAVTMASAQVMGNDVTISVAGQSGNFQLNVMLPVVAFNILQSITLIAASAKALSATIRDFEVNEQTLQTALASNPILVTALNPVIGYTAAAAIAKRAYAVKRPILEVALEMTDMDRATLARLLDPHDLATGDPDSD
jgi:fumarate hydratase class II